MAVVMHFERELDGSALSGLTANLVTALHGTHIASRNTIHLFL